jgi:serine/threonine protein kinase
VIFDGKVRMPLELAGRLIGRRYRVLQAIGEGGMGTVWLCRDETLHREVAVKGVGLLPGESVTDSARALREARSSAALSHRNVVTVFDVVEEDGSIWLVMEHVPGRSLSEIIKEDGPLDPATAADIGAQVADGLAAAHAVGTIHRDVKPGNVLVTTDGVAKISDFGIARNAGDPALTQSGFLTGTPSYFSPELARGREPGPESDVWALGATLYAAVEGHSPYQQRTNPVAVLHDIASQNPPTPERAGFLEPALNRMMDRDPASRWSMRDAAHALRRLADKHRENTRESALGAPATAAFERPTPTPAPAEPSTAAPRTAARPAPAESSTGASYEVRPRRRRTGAYAVLAALLLLIVLGGIAWVASQRGHDPSSSASKGSSAGAKHSSTPKKSPSANHPSSASQQSSTTPAPTRTSAPASGSGTSAADQARFLRDYFSTAPGGTDAGWAMLGPHERAKAGGRGGYDGFWRTIRSADASNVSATDGGSTAQATITYHRTDGSSTSERHTYRLIRSHGHYLLDDES